jgi:hypothetical protein
MARRRNTHCYRLEEKESVMEYRRLGNSGLSVVASS